LPFDRSRAITSRAALLDLDEAPNTPAIAFGGVAHS
jgi:hypothetical protein